MQSKCSKCNGEAFRYCSRCQQYFCPEHLCGHLITEDVDDELLETGNSWLSNDAIIATFTDNQLHEARRRYESILVTIKMEIARRSVTPVKPKPKIPAAIEHVARTAGLAQEDVLDFLRFVKEKIGEIPNRNRR